MSGILCAIPIVASLLGGCQPAAELAVGYVEGEYVFLSPVAAAELTEVAVRRGDRVSAGQLVARQETTDAEIALSEAESAQLQTAAELENLLEGSRPEEIAVIEASLAAARAQIREAVRVAERQKKLVADGYVSQSVYDRAETELELAQTRARELEARLAVAKLPARASVIKAARKRLDGAKAAVRRAEWALAKRELTSPVDGEVADVFRHAGEIAGPAAPVVSILPDGAVKLKVYVPETALARLAIGESVVVNCDGCGGGARARISYISPDPEFTPPVIYSLTNRQKLVYLVEARPTGDDSRLKPGQIVDVVLSEAGG
ncbi:MAG: HlyD family secretion protein [Paracoccaceae bacterium]